MSTSRLGHPKVADVDVRGTKRPVYVDPQGVFYALVDGSRLDGHTLAQCREKLLHTTLKLRIALPCEHLRDDGATQIGTVVGIHADTGNALMKIDGQKGSRQEYWGDWSRRLTPAERAEWLRLTTAYESAEAAVSDFKERAQYNGNLKQEAKDALARVLDLPAPARAAKKGR